MYLTRLHFGLLRPASFLLSAPCPRPVIANDLAGRGPIADLRRATATPLEESLFPVGEFAVANDNPTAR